MQSGAQARPLVWLLVVAALMSLGVGCRTTATDLNRWANTKQGPKKIIAVLVHDKYPLDLRVTAAMTLVNMKPRNGKRVGIVGDEGDEENPGLIEALAELEPNDRSNIVGRMIPALVAGMSAPVPEAPAGQAPVDPSFPFKDTAYALLTYEQAQLVTNAKDRAALDAALASWCVTDFARRVDDASQLYGVEQVLKYLKAEGVRQMPALLVPDAPKIDLMAKLIAELGDEQTKLAASKRLVDIAKSVNSDAWKKNMAPSVDAANKASKLSPTKDQFEAQLDQYQEETLLKVFASMKQVGRAPIVDYLLDFASTEGHADKKRAAALAALEGNLVTCKGGNDCDARTVKNVNRVLEIARSDGAPDMVRDQALRRIGEMPRQLVVDKLYALFKNEKWKIRWMAADLVLTMSKDSQVDEFMTKLDEATTKLAIAEPLQYGFRLGELKGKTKPEALADRYATPDHDAVVRTTALGYFFHHGKATDLPHVMKYADDNAKVPDAPECENAVGCAWECEVAEGTSSTVKEIKTIGEFVTYCVKPAMEKRKDDKKKDPKK